MIFNTQTKLYGVIGSPVKHSASPKIFNQIFSAHHVNAAYLAFEHSSITPLIEGMKALGISGYAVTIPFKEAVMEYVDEVDTTAQVLGCANTIHNIDGKLTAYNFDGIGGLGALVQYCKESSQDWTNKHIVFLGNGGAARGILLTLAGQKDFNGRAALVARKQNKSEVLQSEVEKIRRQNNLSKDFLMLHTWDSLHEGAKAIDISTDSVIINTTSLGMSPNEQVSPLPEKIAGDKPADFFKPGVIAYDIVYNPLMTKFLRDAKNQGAGVVTGENMFLSQASMQLKVWTGLKLELAEMREYFNKQV